MDLEQRRSALAWFLCALGSAVASGDELPVQLAVSLPAVVVAGPVAVGQWREHPQHRGVVRVRPAEFWP